MIDLNDSLLRFYVRAGFGPNARAQIYSTLAMLLDNGVQLIKAIDRLYAVHSQDGRKASAPVALFLAEARTQIREGKPLSAAVARFTDREEASIIEAGERSGQLRQAFKEAIENIQRKKKIGAAIWGGAAYPSVLTVMLAVMLHIVATRLMPQLAKAVDLESLSGSALVLHKLSSFVVNQGLIALIVLTVLVAACAYSLPRLTGRLRTKLDMLPPWSIYKASTGATFLLNFAVMVQSGIKQLDALQQLNSRAAPYLRERIGATIEGIKRGRNFGEALHDCGLDFPSAESVRLLLLLSDNSGFDRTLHSFAVEWANNTVARVQRIMTLFFYAALFAVGGTALLIVTSTTEIQNAIEASSSR